MYNHDVLWFKMRPIITQTCLGWWHQGPHSCATTMEPHNFYYAMERRCALVGLKLKVSVPFLRFSCGCCLLSLFFFLLQIYHYSNERSRGVLTNTRSRTWWAKLLIYIWLKGTSFVVWYASNGGIQTLCNC